MCAKAADDVSLTFAAASTALWTQTLLARRSTTAEKARPLLLSL